MRSFVILFFTTISLCLCSLNALSQNDVTLEVERNNDNTVDFIYEKKIYGSVFLNVILNNLENSISQPFRGSIKGMRGQLFKLTPTNPSDYINFSYAYTWIRGELNPKFDSTFVYLLPVSKGKSIHTIELVNLSSTYFGAAQPRNWKAFQFKLNQGDTVFSARKGIVVDIIDGNKADTTTEYSYKCKTNSILIEHEDGTLAHYDVLKNKSIMVSLGQKIFSHTPLALAGSYDLAKNTQCRFYVYYLTEDKLERSSKSTFKNQINYYAFINPVFSTTDGTIQSEKFKQYTSDYTQEMLFMELSKRERKKLGL